MQEVEEEDGEIGNQKLIQIPWSSLISWFVPQKQVIDEKKAKIVKT